MPQKEYPEALTEEYKEVVDELKKEGYSGGITEATEVFEEKAESLGISTGHSEARDALITFAAKGEIEIYRILGTTKMVEMKSE